MGLSRLENFLRSARGTTLHVDPNNLDSTDSIENDGASALRPFKTIQRALIESARFSYQAGLNNDRFNKTTILLYPGDHFIDNRPGYIPDGASFKRRSGETVSDLTQWDLNTNFDLSSPDNALYKLNSIFGGVIIPRGTSIVGMDLRKTKIRPLYVPNPENDNIERSCIFRTTGACYFWQFTILDADPNGNCFKDYTSNLFVPNFSHHKLTGFEYADGINSVNINDTFLTYSTSRTDLDMYYEKVGIVYGPSSGKEIKPDYNNGVVDIQPVVDEYRIVGPKGASVGITSIRSGNGITGSTTITVDIVEPIDGLSLDSPIQINGIGVSGYDGQFVISSVLSSTSFTYKVQNTPSNPLPSVTGATLDLVVDTVTSASPYIFNISLRSVYGMCGLLADGDKATGFKSMVVAQYTGIGLQKDDNAFVKYNETSGDYQYSSSIVNLHTNSRSRFRPEYENFHIKATNDAFLQLVSVFAIGYAQHFVTENGGDIALNNSNSNFGAKSLVATGFKRNAFSQDDQGYITHIIPPKEIENTEVSIEFNSIDVGLTTSVGISSNLYLYNQTDINNPPQVIIDGYHIGAKENEELTIQVFNNDTITYYSSRVTMPSGIGNTIQYSSEKSFRVGRSAVGINSINVDDVNTLTLTQNHSFINGETIRIISNDGNLPDGLESNQVYYAITTGLDNDKLKIAKTLNDSINNSAITLNNKGGILSIVSRITDKNAGDIGHPVQWDNSRSQWYINVSTENNEIYNAIDTLGVGNLGNATSKTYVTRTPDSRSLIDTLYRVRYVIPKNSPSATRPPIDGFILQESNDILGSGTAEISQLYNNSGSLSNITSLRNPNFIATASWNSNVVTIRSERSHYLKVGDEVEIFNILPFGYNGTYTVSSVISRKEFTYSLSTNPGIFNANTSNRTTSLPYFKRKKYSKTYQVYKVQEIQPYVNNIQDGVYYLTLLNHSNNPTVTPFREQSFAQPIEYLYPQKNNDNPKSDPESSTSHALSDVIGKVVVNELQNSITKETLESFIVGFGITNIRSTSGTSHTVYTSVDHGLAGITSVSIVSGGSNYGSTSGFSGDLYNATLVGFAGSTTGSNATAKITVNSGAITAIKIIDGGSAYGIGNTLSISGVGTTAGFVSAVVRVESVSNNVNDTIKVFGIKHPDSKSYNNLYRVSQIEVGKPKELNVISCESISGFSTTGLGATITANSSYILTGKSLVVSSLEYDSTTGIATVGFTTSHGFIVNQKLNISGANQVAFNGDFIVNKINSLISLTINVGSSATTSTTATGSLFASLPTLTSFAGDLTNDIENISGRLSYEYAGITTTLRTQYTSTSSTTLDIPNAVALGLNLGDYLLINNEIFRISSAVNSDGVSVIRSVLGSPLQTHVTGSVIRRIQIHPIEFRRNSIIRASGHTFEYLGYGPGNYSTSLPDKQDRVLSTDEKFLAQSTKIDGGLIVYTGMDSEGGFYAGNKKINSATGKEETFDTPIPSFTGEKDVDNVINLTDTQKIFVSNSIHVEGGRDKSTLSEFNGPVVFNNKLTSNSIIESNSISLQGNEEISRNISVSNIKPLISGNYGDIKFNSTPKIGGNAGWIYTTNNEWKPFGWINDKLYGVGISTNSGPVGLSTLINITGSNIDITNTYDAVSGISTLNFTVNFATSSYSNVAGVATYANTAGIATYASRSGIATYATTAGIATYAATSGIATYASTAGIATYASRAGIATYADNAGISTHIKGGTQNQLVYQVAPNSTGFIPNGTTNQILKTNGASSAPEWVFIDDLIGSLQLNPETIKIHSTDGNSGDASTFITLVGNDATGYQNAFIDSDLKYSASTSTLESGSFFANGGSFLGNATSATTATTATTAGYASSSGISTYSNTAGIATYASNSGISTNLKGGIASQIPYQTSANTTAFIPNGTTNQLLRSNGTAAPSWTSNLNVGIITATEFRGGTFFGDGSGLTGITASGGGLTILDDNIIIGTAGTVNFGVNLSVSTISAGVCTITSSNSVGIATTALNAETIRISSIDGNSGDTTTYITLVSNNTTGFQTSFIDSDLVYNASSNSLTASTFIGNLTGTASTSLSISLANDASDSDCFITFANNATGNQALKTNGNLRYNAVSDILTVGTINGAVNIANQVKTQSTSSTNTHYLTLVDSNNESPNPETVYTNSGIYYQLNSLYAPTLVLSNGLYNSLFTSILGFSGFTSTGTINLPGAIGDNPFPFRVTLSFDNVRTDIANSPILIQVAQSNLPIGQFVTSGYSGRIDDYSINDYAESWNGQGFTVISSNSTGGSGATGQAIITRVSPGKYIFSSLVTDENAGVNQPGVFKSAGRLIYSPLGPIPSNNAIYAIRVFTPNNIAKISGTIGIICES